MKLPSKYLVQKVEVREGEEVRKWEGISAEIASRLEGIRRKAYDMISKIFANVEDYGVWVAVTEEAVKEAQKISEWVRKELSALPITQVKDVDVDKLYNVKVVTIYLEPEDAKELLTTAIRHLSEDVEELEKKIAEAEREKNKKALDKLLQDSTYKKTLLNTFKEYLSKLELQTKPTYEVRTEETSEVRKPVKESVLITS